MKSAILSSIISLFLATPIFAANLAVPFTPQAPYGNWTQPWQDACEEATIVMVDYFYRGIRVKVIPQNQARDSISHANRVKTNAHGWSLDEDAKKIVLLINEFYGWEARVVNEPSIEQIKLELDNGRPVILPTYGKALLNPYFSLGGPEYHTIVISGYDNDKKQFITQEPGTKRGLDYRYSYDRLMDAMHDYLPGAKTKFGKKVAIFTSPSIDLSALTDGDRDGLNKAEEMQTGTILYLADSDGDGYSDGVEVENGYSPLLAEENLDEGTLVKDPKNSAVYIVENGQKRHIPDESTFISRGFRWADIFVVSSKFLSRLREGLALR
jgi:hypothetical protein